METRALQSSLYLRYSFAVVAQISEIRDIPPPGCLRQKIHHGPNLTFRISSQDQIVVVRVNSGELEDADTKETGSYAPHQGRNTCDRIARFQNQYVGQKPAGILLAELPEPGPKPLAGRECVRMIGGFAESVPVVLKGGKRLLGRDLFKVILNTCSLVERVAAVTGMQIDSVYGFGKWLEKLGFPFQIWPHGARPEIIIGTAQFAGRIVNLESRSHHLFPMGNFSASIEEYK